MARPPGRVRVGSMLIQHRVRSAGLGLMRWVPFGIAALPAGTTDEGEPTSSFFGEPVAVSFGIGEAF